MFLVRLCTGIEVGVKGMLFVYVFFGGGGLWNGELGLVLGGIGGVLKEYRGTGGYQFFGFDLTQKSSLVEGKNIYGQNSPTSLWLGLRKMGVQIILRAIRYTWV